MKKSSKHNLLAKDEPLKEKQQKDWVQMETVNDWKNKKSENHDTSYMKFEEEYSEIEGDNMDLNKGNLNSSYMSNGSQNYQQKKPKNVENFQKSGQENLPSWRLGQQAEEKVRPSTSIHQPESQLASLPQQNRQSSQMPSQILANPYNSQYVIKPGYIQRSLIPTNFVNNHLLPNVGPYVSSYSVVNVPPIYSQYQPQEYMINQGNYRRQSQFQPNGYQNNQSQFHNQPSAQNNINRSSINQINRSSYRSSIPEMTVNCAKCTFTQSVPANAQMFICCMCNQIDECFPLYGVFTCGICKAKVIYPHGTSTLIKCTKCQTVNRVDPEPKKKQDQNVVLGKEQTDEQQPIPSSDNKDRQKSQDRMRRDQPESLQEKFPIKDMKKNFQQPFKVLPAKKIEEKSETNLYPDMEEPNSEKRQAIERNKQFHQQLIDLGSNGQVSDENLHKEIFELSEKLDESLVIGKEEEKPEMKIQIPNQSLPLINHQQTTFPSIFD